MASRTAGECGVRADHAVHGDLERQRSQQRQRTGQQAEQEQCGDMRPVGSGLAEQPAEEDDVAHHAPPLRSRLRPRVIVAMAVVHC